MRRVFALLATLLALVVVAQFFLAASGAFDTASKDESFQPHRGLGYGIILFAILLTIVAALARMPGRLIGMTGLVAGLGVVQGLIRRIADALNGILTPDMRKHAGNNSALIDWAIAGDDIASSVAGVSLPDDYMPDVSAFPLWFTGTMRCRDRKSVV